MPKLPLRLLSRATVALVLMMQLRFLHLEQVLKHLRSNLLARLRGRKRKRPRRLSLQLLHRKPAKLPLLLLQKQLTL